MKVKKCPYRLVGQQNYFVPNCPVLIPKENINFFRTMQKACSVNPFAKYANAYRKK